MKMPSIPEQMKAIVIQGVEHAEVVALPVPKPQAGQVLVKVTAVTTCPQWDLHIYYGRPMFVGQDEVPFPYMPGQPGHEMVGIVAAVGEGTSFQPGQAVCAWRDAGHDRPGCYAEYVLMEDRHLITVPYELHYSEVASLELAMCVAATVLRLKQMIGISGKRCGVNGLGPAGLIAIQMLIAEGASEVIGIDVLEKRRTLALQLGAAAVYEANSDDLPHRHQFDALELAVDCVGYPEAVSYIMGRTREAVALFAVQRDGYVLNHQGLSVIGYPGHHIEAAKYALQLITAGQLQLRPLITKELPLEAYAEAIQLLKNQEAIKVCFVP